MSKLPPLIDQITITQCVRNSEGHNSASRPNSRSPSSSCHATRLRLSRFQERLATTSPPEALIREHGNLAIDSRSERRKRRYDPSSESDDDFVHKTSKRSFSANHANMKSTGGKDEAILPSREHDHFPFSFDSGEEPKSPLSREEVVKKHNNLLLKNKRLTAENRLLRKEILFLRQQMTMVKCCVASPTNDMIANWPLSDEEIDNHGECVTKNKNR